MDGSWWMDHDGWFRIMDHDGWIRIDESLLVDHDE